MIPISLFDEIEAPTFAAAVGVVSTPRRFDQVLGELKSVRQLLALLLDSQARAQLQARAEQLLARSADEPFSHDFDIALAVYVRALDIAAGSDALMLAMKYEATPGLWWARFAAQRVLSTLVSVRRSDHVMWSSMQGTVRSVGAFPGRSLVKRFTVPSTVQSTTTARTSTKATSITHSIENTHVRAVAHRSAP